MNYPAELQEIMTTHGEQLMDRMQQVGVNNMEALEDQVLAYAKQEELNPRDIRDPELKRLVDEMAQRYSRELVVQCIEYIIKWRINANQNFLGIRPNSNAETVVSNNSNMEGGKRHKHRKTQKRVRKAKKSRKSRKSNRKH
jgi:hypothetical protein